MGNSYQAARKYLHQVSRWLPCSRKQKKTVLENIDATLSEYLEENPDADMIAISKRFGTAEQIAASYVEDMETVALLRDLRIRKRIVSLVGIAVITVLLIWGAVVTKTLVDHNNYNGGFITQTIFEEIS